jgi:hypothetical protein
MEAATEDAVPDVVEDRDPAPRDLTPERICPVCGSELLERKCKLLCPDPACGYYLSCSDFY